MVGIREPALYGGNTYKELKQEIRAAAENNGVKVRLFQSNEEGKIVTAIQRAYKKYDGIIINAGAYTHTSIAILDALKAVNIRTAEVHLTDINAREDFRRKSFISLFAEEQIVGKGFAGYTEAIEYFAEKR